MPNLTRRTLLSSATALVFLPNATKAETLETEVTARPAEVQLAPPDYPATAAWTYDGTVPGAGLRVPQGTRLQRTLINQLPEPTTIHWHGIRLPNEMDGVANLTQPPVAPGETFLYDFILPDAGTFWYHPHYRSLEQVARGLSAPLVVEEAEAPDVDDDIVLMINDWRLDENAQIVEDFDNFHDRAHAGRIGNYLTVNGQAEHVQRVKRNTRLRLRLINAATDRILTIAGTGLEGFVMALDGMPLEVPERFAEIVLAPGQRADLFADITAAAGETASLASRERGGDYVLADFPVTPGGERTRLSPSALPPNAIARPILAGARSAPLLMTGGAMGGMRHAMTSRGQPMTPRGLASQGLAWAFNGIAGMPPEPLIEAVLGETIRIPIDNQTAFAHAMHLHGHHFREVTADGLGPVRDTILIGPRAKSEIVFVADNPGDWMFHCHMLAHQAAGMMTWIRVT